MRGRMKMFVTELRSGKPPATISNVIRRMAPDHIRALVFQQAGIADPLESNASAAAAAPVPETAPASSRRGSGVPASGTASTTTSSVGGIGTMASLPSFAANDSSPVLRGQTGRLADVDELQASSSFIGYESKAPAKATLPTTGLFSSMSGFVGGFAAPPPNLPTLTTPVSGTGSGAGSGVDDDDKRQQRRRKKDKKESKRNKSDKDKRRQEKEEKKKMDAETKAKQDEQLVAQRQRETIDKKQAEDDRVTSLDLINSDDKQFQHEPHKYLALLFMVGALASADLSIIFPSLYSYTASLSQSYLFYGMLAAAFNVGQMISTFFMGPWADNRSM
jgi:hypothetical protein